MRQPSASLIPRNDPSTLLISAGMHPLKPYFTGREHAAAPPADHRARSASARPTSTRSASPSATSRSSRCSATSRSATTSSRAPSRWRGSSRSSDLGFDPERIWITVFEGDDELGLGPDEEAIEAWLSVGVPRERIVLLPRSENFWQAGSTGPCGPCSELYYDRGLEFGAEDDLPGGDNERFLEYWNLVFMQYDQEPEGVLTPLPAQNIDTGLGLERMAAIQQGTDSVFETDHFKPLIELGEQLSGRTLPPGRRHRPRAAHPRRPLARHVVPDRRRRRALQRGPRLRPAPDHAPRDPAGPPDRHRARLPAALRRRRARAHGRRLPRAARAGRDHRHVARARGGGVRPDARAGHAHPRRAHRAREGGGRRGHRRGRGLPAPRHLRLPVRPHARARRRAGARRRRGGLREPDGGPAHARPRERGPRRARRGPRARAGVRARRRLRHRVHRLRDRRADDRGRRDRRTENGQVLAKLVESPFYATGGGQVHDARRDPLRVRRLRRARHRRAADRRRPGAGARAHPGRAARGRARRRARRPRRAPRHRGQPHRHAPPARGAARAPRHPRAPGRLLRRPRQAALRLHPRLAADRRGRARGRGPRQRDGSSPTSRCARSRRRSTRPATSARWPCSARSTATSCGWSRSATAAGRASCAAARTSARPPRSAPSSSPPRPRARPTSAASRRSPARWRSSRCARATASSPRRRRCCARSRTRCAEIAAEREAKRRELEKGGAQAEPVDAGFGAPIEVDGVKLVVETKRRRRTRSCCSDLADRIKGKLGDPAVVVLGAPGDGKSTCSSPRRPAPSSAASRPATSSRPRRRSSAAAEAAATTWPRPAAAIRRSCPTPSARARGCRAAGAGLSRVVALDYGSARCGVAVSDPTRTLATPLDPVLRPATRKGFGRLVALIEELEADDRARRAAAVAVRRRLRPDPGDPSVRPAVE